jgi:hypothetical protein
MISHRYQVIMLAVVKTLTLMNHKVLSFGGLWPSQPYLRRFMQFPHEQLYVAVTGRKRTLFRKSIIEKNALEHSQAH